MPDLNRLQDKHRRARIELDLDAKKTSIELPYPKGSRVRGRVGLLRGSIGTTTFCETRKVIPSSARSLAQARALCCATTSAGCTTRPTNICTFTMLARLESWSTAATEAELTRWRSSARADRQRRYPNATDDRGLFLQQATAANHPQRRRDSAGWIKHLRRGQMVVHFDGWLDDPGKLIAVPLGRGVR